jgi:GNAT superfamily N-acetyltransferase
MTIILRPAQPNDKSAITALAAKIWDGEDYLHHNFDKWVAEERGRFIVCYEGDILVGCNKLTEFRPGEWWMEGLRVDPAFRGRGMARVLHENIMRIADEIATAENLTGNLRLATESENYAVHKLALETGFTNTSRHSLYRTDIPTGGQIPPSSPFTIARLSEKDQVDDWFNQSEYFATTDGLFEDTWKWYEILPRLEELLQDGRIQWWHKEGAAAGGLIIIHRRDPETMVLNYLDAPNGRWADLLDDTRLLARTLTVSQIKSKPLALPAIQTALPSTAWKIDYDLEMWVFQRTIG